VARKDLPIVYRSGQELVDLLEAVGLKLKVSCWDLKEDTFQVINHWDLGGDADNLFKAELELPDRPGYADFDHLIVKEDKHIVVRLSDDEGYVAPSLTERYVYLRTLNRVAAVDLAEFAARLESDLVPFKVANGWLLGETYLAVSGRAGEVVQLWRIPESSVRFAVHRLSTAEWNELFKDRPNHQFYEPTPFDPFTKQSRQDLQAMKELHEGRAGVRVSAPF
jgi:hypothetical protein